MATRATKAQVAEAQTVGVAEENESSEETEAQRPAFKRKGQVTFPVLKKKDDEPVYVKILQPIFTGKEMKQKQGEQKMQPARIARVVNLETGELQEMICNAVLESTLTESFPDDGYVGKCFEIIQHAGVQGKRYKTFSVWELDCGA